jgi:hypothetical protein
MPRVEHDPHLRIPCFSDNAVTAMKAALADVGMDEIWKARNW